MSHAPVEEWAEKAKGSAALELERLIRTKATEHASKTQTEITVTPVELPVDQFYGTWDKGLFSAASFDSWTGEYLLVMRRTFSQDIRWWKRLYPHEGASIAYSTRNNYFPDFIAQDQAGRYWIIEGKSDKGHDDHIVQQKREAAVNLVSQLVSTPALKTPPGAT